MKEQKQGDDQPFIHHHEESQVWAVARGMKARHVDFPCYPFCADRRLGHTRYRTLRRVSKELCCLSAGTDASSSARRDRKSTVATLQTLVAEWRKARSVDFDLGCHTGSKYSLA